MEFAHALQFSYTSVAQEIVCATDAIADFRGTLDRLDVYFISSLPVTPGTVYKAWVNSTPVQMVWGVD
jgi:hypothetical protein